jgi:hypothetical protein
MATTENMLDREACPNCGGPGTYISAAGGKIIVVACKCGYNAPGMAVAGNPDAYSKREQDMLDRQRYLEGVIVDLQKQLQVACHVKADDKVSFDYHVLSELQDKRDTLDFHPRAAKLMRKRKNFIVIAEDEPYFVDAYMEIRKHEKAKGTWTDEDEKQYRAAFTRWHTAQFADGSQADKWQQKAPI